MNATLTFSELLANNLFERTRSLQYLPRWAVLLLDILLCSISFAISYLIGKGIFYQEYSQEILSSWQQGLLLLIIQCVFFCIFRTYNGIIRYSTFVDALKCLFSVFATAATFIIINYIIYLITDSKCFYNTVAIIYAFVAFVGLFSLRVSVKTLFEFARGASGKKVMIYGIQSAGIAIAKILRNTNLQSMRPVGFICDANESSKYELAGLRVHKLDNDLIQYMHEHHIDCVIVSPLKMQHITPSKNLKIFLDNHIQILTTPFFTDWENVEQSTSNQNLASKIGRIDAIQVEDLLDRPTISINLDNVNQCIQGKVVLVSGAAGSIGSELVKQVIQYTPKVVLLLDQAESPLHDLVMDLQHDYADTRVIAIIGDIRNRERLDEIFNEMRPDIIFHAAAYKHVPLMENHPNEAIQANVMGTKNMADMAVKYHVERFVMISTDKAVNPTNIMGASKRIAEIYVQSLFNKLVQTNPDCTKFITTRFGNVLGSNGSVIPYFKKQIANGGPVTVTHPDIIRYFMTIPEACTLVLEAATLGNGGEIFVFDMGHPVKIYDLAKNMIQLSGLVPGKDIQIVFTGLRPGEKLYEELLNQKETTLPTSNQKIMRARVREFEFDQVSPEIDKLIQISYDNKIFTTVEQMKKLVPEFISRNSIFEKLDK